MERRGAEHRRRLRYAAVAFSVLWITLALPGCAERTWRLEGREVRRSEGSAGAAPFLPDATLQRLVDPRPAASGLSWLGGDVATSARLTEDIDVWIFGDTLLGKVSDRCSSRAPYCDRRVADEAVGGMIANSVGVMRRRPDGGFSPLVTFWRTRRGRPAPIFEASDPREFLWPLALVRVGRHLLVTASRHTRASGLYSRGNVFLRVRNPEARPDVWICSRHAVPNVIPPGGPDTSVTWSTALARVGAFVYVFGELGVGFDARTVLSRLVVREIEASDWAPRPEYLLRKSAGSGLVWSREFALDRLYPVDGLPGTSEATIAFDPAIGWYSYQIPPFGFEVRLYRAAEVSGPWLDGGIAYEVPDPWRSTRREKCPAAEPNCNRQVYSAYAVKAHPELAKPGGQVLSYSVNVSSGNRAEAELAAAREREFYVPRIISCQPSAGRSCWPR